MGETQFRRINVGIHYTDTACGGDQIKNATVAVDERNNVYIDIEGRGKYNSYSYYANTGDSFTPTNMHGYLSRGQTGVDDVRRAQIFKCVKDQVRDPIVLKAMETWEKANQVFASGSGEGTFNYGTGTVFGEEYIYTLQGNTVFIDTKERITTSFFGCGAVTVPKATYQLNQYGELLLYKTAGTRDEVRNELVFDSQARDIFRDIASLTDDQSKITLAKVLDLFKTKGVETQDGLLLRVGSPASLALCKLRDLLCTSSTELK